MRPFATERRNAHGATIAASLTSELSDTASLDYLRLWSHSDPGAREANLDCEKQKGYPELGILFVWRSRRDLNSRAGIADLHP